MTAPTPPPTGRTRRSHRAAPPPRREPATDWARGHITEMASCLLGVGSVALGFAYQTPALTRPVPRPGARQISIVQTIDAIGPVWFAGFTLTGVACLVGLIIGPRVMVYAHSAGFVVCGMFSCAVWLGWAFSDPRPAIVSPILAVVVTGVQLLALLAYSGRRG